MKKFRILLVIALFAAGCCTLIVGIVYVLLAKFEEHIDAGILVSKPSPVAVPVKPRAHSSFVHFSSAARQTTSVVTDMPSTQGLLFTTSSARTHMIGGGASYATAASTSHNTSSRGISYSGSAVMPMTTFVAMASVRQVAQPEATEAPQMAAPVRHAPGPPTPPGPLPEDNQLIEHPEPIGDILWPMMLCALVFGIVRRRRRIESEERIVNR